MLNREYLRAIAVNPVINTPFRLVSLIYLYDEIYRYNEFDAKNKTTMEFKQLDVAWHILCYKRELTTGLE